MEYKDPGGDFKFINHFVKCPACGWESSVLGLNRSIKIRLCDLCEHAIHL